MTPRDIIIAAMKKCGALARGQTLNGEDFKDAFQELNMMLSDWATKRTMVYCTKTYSKVSTGALAYSVGPGGDFAMRQRPARLLSAFCRQLVVAEDPQGTTTPGRLNPDYPVEILEAKQDYDRIATKGIFTIPTYLFYDPQWPLGQCYFWPIPLPSKYELFISALLPLTQFSTINLVVNLPPEYEQALVYNLAVRLGETYSLPPRPVTITIAKESLATLRKANSRIARLRMPNALVRTGVYNPYSDQTR